MVKSRELIFKLFERNYSRDFGTGFYLTVGKDVPDRTARNESISKFFKIKSFYTYDKEWVDFVVGNRFNERYEHYYDLVFGPKTTDKIYNLLRKYVNKEMDTARLLKLLNKEEITYQYGYHTDNALEPLKILVTELLKKNEVFSYNAVKVKWACHERPSKQGGRRVAPRKKDIGRRNITEIADIRITIYIIESLARFTDNKRQVIIKLLGLEAIEEIINSSPSSSVLNISEIIDELIIDYNIPRGEFIHKNEYENLPSIELVVDYMTAHVDGIDQMQTGIDHKLIFNFFNSPLFSIIYNYDNHLYYLCDRYIITCFRSGKILYNGETKLKYVKK